MELESRVEAFVRQYRIFSPGSRIVIACSGGPDSLALAAILLELQNKWQLTLRIAHFEHGIRGGASLADAEFVRDFAGEWNVPFELAREDIPDYARRKKLSLETAARERRYRFLKAAADKMGPDALIATGHHAGDQAETVLMHLMRGSGIDGLAGMRPRTDNRIRPLLCLSRQDILEYLEKKKLTPRWDETNFMADAARNQVRLEILPVIRRYSPAIEDSLCRLAEAEAEAADFLRFSADRVWDSIVKETGEALIIRRTAYKAQPAAVRKTILRRIATEMDLRQFLAYAHYEALDRFCLDSGPGKELMLPQSRTAECRYDEVVLRRGDKLPLQWDEKELSLAGTTRIEKIGLTIHASPWKPGDNMPEDSASAVVDLDALPLPLKVRSRRNGDSFLLDNHGHQKLKAFLIDRKVPRTERDSVPIFTASDDQIFWVGGFRRAALAFVKDDTKNAVLFRLVWDNAADAKG